MSSIPHSTVPAAGTLAPPLPEPTPAPHSESQLPPQAPSPLVRFVPDPEPDPRPEPAVPPEMQVDVASDARHDLIEEIFQRVEQETARRAQQEEERSRPSTASQPSSTSASTPSSGPTPAPSGTVSLRDTSTVAAVRDRRRGSISVSRFGQATDLSSGTLDNPSSLPARSRKNSLIINASSTGAFYQAQEYAGSADSFASASEPTPAPHDETEEQVTQMETIAGKVSLGKAVGRTIARRLSRARSRDILTVPVSLVGPGAAGGVVIGVSVEEATVEAEAEGEHHEPLPGTPRGTTFVFAQAEALNVAGSTGTRSRRSTVSMPNPMIGRASTPTSVQTPDKDKDSKEKEKERDRRPAPSSWVAKAIDLTRRLKRRSMGVLPQPQNVQNSAP